MLLERHLARRVVLDRLYIHQEYPMKIDDQITETSPAEIAG